MFYPHDNAVRLVYNSLVKVVCFIQYVCSLINKDILRLLFSLRL